MLRICSARVLVSVSITGGGPPPRGKGVCPSPTLCGRGQAQAAPHTHSLRLPFSFLVPVPESFGVSRAVSEPTYSGDEDREEDNAPESGKDYGGHSASW